MISIYRISVTDFNNQRLSFFVINKIICYTLCLELVGKIESNGTVRNSSGNSIGKVESDGTVRNGSGSSVGKVESDGTVRNSSGNQIGSASGVKKEWAAAFFFFNFF